MGLLVFIKSRFLFVFLFFCFLFSCLPVDKGGQSSSAKKVPATTNLSQEESSQQNLDNLLSSQLGGLNFGSLGSFGGGEEASSVGDNESQIRTGSASDIFWNSRFPKTYLTSYLNTLKKNTSSTDYMCPPYSFVVGQYSLYHQDANGREWADRQYRLKCQYLADGLARDLTRAKASTCVEATKQEFKEYYKTVYTCPKGKFFSGHMTTFEGDKKTRSHRFSCCDIEHADKLQIIFPEYLVYSLEHAGPQKNCKVEADATSYARRYHWEYECPAHSLLAKVTITNIPEAGKIDSYTEYNSKPEDPIFGYECCQVGVQQDTNSFIYGYSQSAEGGLPYDLFPKE